MARTVEEINDYIIANLVANFAAIGVTIDTNTWSKRNMLRATCYTDAIGQALMEQLQDVYFQKIEGVQARSAAASVLWIQDAMFRFQYSDTVPQALQLIDFTAAYPIIDPTLRIITACSVRTTISNQVLIKVAKSNPFEALSGTELTSAQGYINIKGAAGIFYVVTSSDADRLYIDADVYFRGEYSSVIQATVIQAINDFLQSLSISNFDGSIKMSDLEATIRAVAGVNDVVLRNVRARKDSDAFADGTDIVLNQLQISRLWNTVAGYIIQEDTAGKTFADSLTFLAQ